jgi:D-alanyl-D-alanine carboxypeptidase (penicillin-binding protein 5/6)
MAKPARRLSLLSVFLAAAAMLTAAVAPAAQAQSLYNQPKYAAIVVDAASGEVLYARRADQPRYPASITKVMTLYLVFEALATGRLKLDDQVTMSQHAVSQPPSKSGLRAGESISVDTALRVAALKSANDVAVALAEKVGGSESRFAALMTLRAQELGMTNTRFVNAHGLPDSRQITTARDIAILSRAVMRDYPQYYSYFSQKTYGFRGQQIRNHNSLLHKMPGVDGLKTGFTNAAGYNLAASAVRDGRRLITVVLGGGSTASRDNNVEELLDAGFDVLARRKVGQNITIAANMREPDDVAGPIMRPSTEMGSGTQSGLQVVVADAAQNAAQLRASPDPIGEAVANSWLSQAGAVAGSAPGAGSGLKAATLALSNSEAETAARTECSKVSVKEKVKATRRKRAHTVTRVKTVCKTVPRDSVQVAKAEPLRSEPVRPEPVKAEIAKADLPKPADCAAAGKPKAKTAKARAAAQRAAAECKTSNTAIAANAKSPAGKGPADKSPADKGAAEKAGLRTAREEPGSGPGGYRIQVGAFDSKGAAEQHLTKITKQYSAVVATASSQVQPANKGAYRARFNGFSASGAKAACAALSAKGERCLVLSPG